MFYFIVIMFIDDVEHIVFDGPTLPAWYGI